MYWDRVRNNKQCIRRDFTTKGVSCSQSADTSFKKEENALLSLECAREDTITLRWEGAGAVESQEGASEGEKKRK
jgi:hypothetical protein